MIHVLIVATTVAVFFVAWRSRQIGDVIALAMPIVLVSAAALVVLVLLIKPTWSAAPIALLALSTYVVFAPRWPHHTRAPVDAVHVAAVNLQFDSRQPAQGVASTLARNADVLVVSELTNLTDELLRVDFPFRVVTDDLPRLRYGEGVYSRFPLTTLAAPTGPADRMLRVRVEAPVPFVLYAVHLLRPTFRHPVPPGMTTLAGERAAVSALDAAADVDARDGPVVITGDLNLSDRTSGYRELASGRIDASRTGWAGSTYVGSLLWSLALLRIDHIFVPEDWCAADARSFTISGSDHRGIEARIGRC